LFGVHRDRYALEVIAPGLSAPGSAAKGGIGSAQKQDSADTRNAASSSQTPDSTGKRY